MIEQKVGLFIDAENIPSFYYPVLRMGAESYGKLVYCNVFGNWQSPTMAGWIKIPAINKYAYNAKKGTKNATDMEIVINVMDVLYSQTINVFCIASNDSDFLPLIARLRQAGVEVIVLGKKKLTPLLQEASSQSIIADNLFPKLSKEDYGNIDAILLFFEKIYLVEASYGDDWISIQRFAKWIGPAAPKLLLPPLGYKNMVAFLKAHPDHFFYRKGIQGHPEFKLKKDDRD